MKSVLIIGAGPAGLVAAKTLLQHAGNKFNVTVFEAADRVGGMWRARTNEYGDKCSPHMRTNLSRFTVAFSDLSWTSVDLTDPVTESKPPEPLSMFPKAWQVGAYLDTYAKRYIPDGVIQFNRRVTGADFVEASQTWNITSRDEIGQGERKATFDHLIVASGFFDQPSYEVSATLVNKQSTSKIQHSSAFRDVAALTAKHSKIVVIGGGISGAEAAATAALQISNAKYAPGKNKPAWAGSKIYHVFNRPFYCLPRYLPQDPYNPAIQDFNLAPKFLPLDLVLYNLSRRGDGPIRASNGQVPSDKAKKGHDFIRSCIGGDQRDLGRSELVYKPDLTQYPAYTGVTDTYNEFVRSGFIIPIQGWAEHITQERNDITPDTESFQISVNQQTTWSQNLDGNTIINDVGGIIEATGFQVHLDYLSSNVKNKLAYDPDCNRIPFLLTRGSIFAPEIPSMAFVGFYEGPYWEVMEMQARLIAQAWARDLDKLDTLAHDLDTSEALKTRQAMKERSLDVPQFWMPDYVGLVEEFSRKVDVTRQDTTFDNQQKGPVFAARYHGANDVTYEVSDLLKQSVDNAKFVAAAVFRAMQGEWTLQRKIDSRHTSMPGGTLRGVAHFHPREPTNNMYSSEYLYIEEGTLTMDNGMSFPATRRYIYRYSEVKDTITAWFTEDDGETVGALFNTWEFYAPTDTYHGWLAKGHHWCSPDTYKSSCEFRFRGASLETFGITYEVEGPKKDYSHESWYNRPK